MVEDKEFIVTVVKKMLESIGAQYEVAYNGQEACKKVEEYLSKKILFDIILMDLCMPVMDGYQASMRIRELELQFKLPDQLKHYICGHSSEANRRKF